MSRLTQQLVGQWHGSQGPLHDPSGPIVVQHHPRRMSYHTDGRCSVLERERRRRHTALTVTEVPFANLAPSRLCFTCSAGLRSIIRTVKDPVDPGRTAYAVLPHGHQPWLRLGPILATCPYGPRQLPYDLVRITHEVATALAHHVPDWMPTGADMPADDRDTAAVCELGLSLWATATPDSDLSQLAVAIEAARAIVPVDHAASQSTLE